MLSKDVLFSTKLHKAIFATSEKNRILKNEVIPSNCKQFVRKYMAARWFKLEHKHSDMGWQLSLAQSWFVLFCSHSFRTNHYL